MYEEEKGTGGTVEYVSMKTPNKASHIVILDGPFPIFGESPLGSFDRGYGRRSPVPWT